MDEAVKCPNGAPPVVRLALRREKCPRAGTKLIKVLGPRSIVDYLRSEYGCEAQEWAVAVGMGADGNIIGIHEIALGGMSAAMVDPRVVFAGLLLMGAASWVLCHNHPSGSLVPSAQDDDMTRQMKSGSKTLGIQLQDHIIVSGTGHYSYLEHGRF